MPATLAYTPDSPEVRHLSAADPTLGSFIERIGPLTQPLETDYFGSLASAIGAQQLSDAAARTIWKRVEDRLGGVTPERVLSAEDETLRATVGWLYGLDGGADRDAVARIGKAWRPYRTAASLYLWRGLALRRAEERAARA